MEKRSHSLSVLWIYTPFPVEWGIELRAWSMLGQRSPTVRVSTPLLKLYDLCIVLFCLGGYKGFEKLRLWL